MATRHAFAFRHIVPNPSVLWRGPFGETGGAEDATDRTHVVEDISISRMGIYAFDGDNYGLTADTQFDRGQPFGQVPLSEKKYNAVEMPRLGMLTPGRSPNLVTFSMQARSNFGDVGPTVLLPPQNDPDLIQDVTVALPGVTDANYTTTGLTGFEIFGEFGVTQPTDVAYDGTFQYLYEVDSFPDSRLLIQRVSSSTTTARYRDLFTKSFSAQQTFGGVDQIGLVQIPVIRDCVFHNLYIVVADNDTVPVATPWRLELLVDGVSQMFVETTTNDRVHKTTQDVSVSRGSKIVWLTSGGGVSSMQGYYATLLEMS